MRASGEDRYCRRIDANAARSACNAFSDLPACAQDAGSRQGCIVYDLMQNNEDPTDFTFHEEWTDEAALHAHSQSAHIASTFAELEGHLAAPPDVRRYRFV